MTIYEALTWLYVALGCIAVTLVVYALLRRRLADLSQPMRLKMVDIAEIQLASDIPAPDKALIRFMLKHVYSRVTAMIMIFAVPVVAVTTVVDYLAGRPTSSAAPNDDCDELAGRFLLSAMAANPLAGAVVLLELIVLGLLVLLIGGPKLIYNALHGKVVIDAFQFFDNRLRLHARAH